MSGYLLFLINPLHFLYYNFVFLENLVGFRYFYAEHFFPNRVLYEKKFCSLRRDGVKYLKSVKPGLIC